LGLQFRLVEALRFGALGYALNFVALGNVGGVVFKALLIARDQPGRRTESAATVVIDRLLGLFVMCFIASAAVLLTDLERRGSPAVVALCQAILMVTVIGGTGMLVTLFVPGLTGVTAVETVRRLPLVGTTAARLVTAIDVYRSRRGMLFVAGVLSLLVDALFVASYYLIARGLPLAAPTLADHFFIVPLGVVAGAIPVTPNGLGTMEAAMDALYRVVPSGTGAMPGDGTIVTLAHRCGMIVVAAIGMVFYAATRPQQD
jgi:uncharacterized membrane protein YbhN (UPF0104 family)